MSLGVVFYTKFKNFLFDRVNFFKGVKKEKLVDTIKFAVHIPVIFLLLLSGFISLAGNVFAMVFIPVLFDLTMDAAKKGNIVSETGTKWTIAYETPQLIRDKYGVDEVRVWISKNQDDYGQIVTSFPESGVNVIKWPE